MNIDLVEEHEEFFWSGGGSAIKKKTNPKMALWSEDSVVWLSEFTYLSISWMQYYQKCTQDFKGS